MTCQSLPEGSHANLGHVSESATASTVAYEGFDTDEAAAKHLNKVLGSTALYDYEPTSQSLSKDILQLAQEIAALPPVAGASPAMEVPLMPWPGLVTCRTSRQRHAMLDAIPFVCYNADATSQRVCRQWLLIPGNAA